MVLSVLTSELFSVGHSQYREIVLVVTDTFWKEGFGGSWSIAPCCPSVSLMVGVMSGRRERGTSGCVGGLVTSIVLVRARSKLASIC